MNTHTAVLNSARRQAGLTGALRDKLIEHIRYIADNGEDLPEITELTW